MPIVKSEERLSWWFLAAGVLSLFTSAIHFLAGPGAAFISGVNLLVDGGLSATLGNSKNSAANKIAKQ